MPIVRQLKNVATVTKVFVVLRLKHSAWELKKINFSEVITCDQSCTIFGPIDRVHISIVNSWPNALGCITMYDRVGAPLNVFC